MRIAFLTHYSSLYGANRSLLDLIRGLGNHGVEPRVIAPSEGQLARVLSSLNVPFVTQRFPWWVSEKKTVGNSLSQLGLGAKALTFLAMRIREWEADVVYSNSSFIHLGLVASKWLGLPHVWHLREFIDLDWELEPDWGWGAFRELTSRSDEIITVSYAVRDHLLRKQDAQRAHVIRSGVASRDEFHRLREEASAREAHGGPYTFALVGFLAPKKGQETAIQALARVARDAPNVRLIIAGSGNTAYAMKCQQLAETLGIRDSVKFLGYTANPFRVMIDADAVLMCSQHEAQGRVTIEAMAACRPVIGRNQGGTPEILEHGRTGLLYEGGPDVLASCMLSFVQNPSWARELGERAWHVAVEKFSIEACAQQVYRVLQRLEHT